MKINIFILFLLICSFSYAEEQKIVSFEAKDVPVLNEELRNINKNTETNLSKINTLRDGGFAIVLNGEQEVATDIIPSRLYLPYSGTFIKIIAYAKTAPTDANLIINVNKNGSTILDASKLTIAAGTNSVIVTSFADTTFSENDYITIDIDQIGSTVAGEDICISFFTRKDIE